MFKITGRKLKELARELNQKLFNSTLNIEQITFRTSVGTKRKSGGTYRSSARPDGQGGYTLVPGSEAIVVNKLAAKDEATLVMILAHEMIHAYQMQIHGIQPDHGGTFEVQRRLVNKRGKKYFDEWNDVSAKMNIEQQFEYGTTIYCLWWEHTEDSYLGIHWNKRISSRLFKELIEFFKSNPYIANSRSLTGKPFFTGETTSSKVMGNGVDSFTRVGRKTIKRVVADPRAVNLIFKKNFYVVDEDILESFNLENVVHQGFIGENAEVGDTLTRLPRSRPEESYTSTGYLSKRREVLENDSEPISSWGSLKPKAPEGDEIEETEEQPPRETEPGRINLLDAINEEADNSGARSKAFEKVMMDSNPGGETIQGNFK